MGRKRARMKNENVNEAFDESGLTEDQIEAIHILEDIGLDFVSSPAQLKHGTLMFRDPMLKDVGYSITKSGYARREIVTSHGYPWSAKDHYQLNAKRPKGMGGGFMTDQGYIPSRIRKPGNYVALAEDIKRVVEKYRKSELTRGGGKYTEPEEREHMEFENKQEDMRAKTVLNEKGPEDHPANARQKYLMKFTRLCQEAANNGLEFEVIQELVESALNEIDWVWAAEEVEKNGVVEPGDPDEGHFDYLKKSGQLKSFDEQDVDDRTLTHQEKLDKRFPFPK
jgi:hypothetical protein